MNPSGAIAVPRPGTLGAWILAARPKTLAAGAAPVCVGTALAFGEGRGRWMPAVAALAGALLIQIGTNLANDYFDFKKGADGADRLGPTRVTQAGLIAPSTVFAGMLVAFGAAFVVGLYLVAVAGWPIVIIGLLSLASGYAYTGGPYPLGYNGLGDLFVFVFFGLVAVAGTYFVQTGEVTALSLVAGAPIGALAAGLLAVNNLRDVETDARAGKRTLVVRLGPWAGKAEYVLAVGTAFAVPVLAWAMGWSTPWVLLALVGLIAAVPALRIVFTAQGRALNAGLGATARLLVLYSACFSAGLYLGAR